jgi:hypothetical protein
MPLPRVMRPWSPTHFTPKAPKASSVESPGILLRSLPSLLRADFFGPEVYGPDADEAWQRYMNLQEELLLTCHLISCS